MMTAQNFFDHMPGNLFYSVFFSQSQLDMTLSANPCSQHRWSRSRGTVIYAHLEVR